MQVTQNDDNYDLGGTSFGGQHFCELLKPVHYSPVNVEYYMSGVHLFYSDNRLESRII